MNRNDVVREIIEYSGELDQVKREYEVLKNKFRKLLEQNEILHSRAMHAEYILEEIANMGVMSLSEFYKIVKRANQMNDEIGHYNVVKIHMNYGDDGELSLIYNENS